MRSKPLRFYTTPPARVYHPYLLVNAADGWDSPWKYRSLHRRRFEHAIMDAGVEHFLKNPDASDYPGHFLERYKHLARQLTQIFGERLWSVIPDYIDDYHPGQVRDNVGKTLRNIEDFVKIEGVNWLPVLQARYLDVLSFYESCDGTKRLLGENAPRLAIGTVCKTKNHAFIAECCGIARKFFPGAWLHAFGPSLGVLPKISGLIDSWDSSAWTFPRQRGRSSAHTREYPEFFEAYKKRIVEVLGGRASLAEEPVENENLGEGGQKQGESELDAPVLKEVGAPQRSDSRERP